MASGDRWRALNISLDGPVKRVPTLSFSPCATKLAIGNGTTVQIWDVNPPKMLFTCNGHRGDVDDLFWSPDGTVLLSTSNCGEILCWDPRIGAQLGRPLEGRSKWVGNLAWRPCHLEAPCRRFACARANAGTSVFDVMSLTPAKHLAGQNHMVTCLRWSGENFIVAGCDDGWIMVWDSSFELTRTLQGHSQKVNSIELTTDFALRFGPYGGGEWATPEEMRAVAQRTFNMRKGDREEMMVSSSADGTIGLWIVRRNALINRIRAHDTPRAQIAFSPNGDLVASCCKDSIKVLNAANGSCVAVWKPNSGKISHIRWSPDGRFLLSVGDADSFVKIWDYNKQQLMAKVACGTKIRVVDWSPGGLVIAVGNNDGFTLFTAR